MSAPVSPFADFDFDTSFGALQIGTMLSMMLLGIALLQTWNYFRDFPGDSTRLKAMVGIVFFVDVLHSIFLVHAVYQYTIRGFLDFSILNRVVWSIDATLTAEAIIIVVVQCYYGLRVLRVTGSHILAGIIWLLALARMALTIAFDVTAIRDGSLNVVRTKAFRWQAVSELAIAALTDICIASVLCIALLRRRTGFERSDQLISNIVTFTVASGLLTSIVSIVQFVTYLTLPGKFVWLACFSISSKLFTNSLLASLNQRVQHRRALLPTGQSGITKEQVSARVDFRSSGQQDSLYELSSMPYAPNKPNEAWDTRP
ncbi:hypothetical protein AURDEDRAFT_187930 [Auricularia subglabra TFB-10046 SS5]|nr:hypothetical protein AURDEDRAFT_187930 [Auricularia subglabra TFB-10046 SS5]